jgi:hypothetical protein
MRLDRAIKGLLLRPYSTLKFFAHLFLLFLDVLLENSPYNKCQQQSEFAPSQQFALCQSHPTAIVVPVCNSLHRSDLASILTKLEGSFHVVQG